MTKANAAHMRPQEIIIKATMTLVGCEVTGIGARARKTTNISQAMLMVKATGITNRRHNQIG